MLEPFEWNVVVAGAWNRALLTPAWLQRRVFKEPEATVELSLPIEFAAPPRVQLRQVGVVVYPGALVVGAMDNKYETLGTAQELASRALEALPETPITAAGINVRYKLGDVPQPTLARTKADLDHHLSDQSFVVNAKGIQRAIVFESGVLNLTLTEDEQAQGTIIFNFHLTTQDVGAARAWLCLSKEKLKGTVDTLLYSCIGIEKVGKDAN